MPETVERCWSQKARPGKGQADEKILDARKLMQI
jgi:hypothetical protein